MGGGDYTNLLIRMAGKWKTGSRQQKLSIPKRMLYNGQWEACVNLIREMTKQGVRYVLNLDQDII